MLILDGSMGQELVRRAEKATDLWSLQALLDAPDMVREVHDEYFAAGADVATTNTYCVLPDRLETKGLMDQFGPLMHLACRMAAEARDANGVGLVAGSLGPFGFSYQPDLCPPAADAAEIYAAAVKLQADYGDVHILETMASVDQARGGLMGASVTGKPVCLSMAVDDTDGSKLRSGEAVADLLPLLQEFKPQAVMINCSLPEVVGAALPALQGQGAQIGAYANGFTSIHKDFSSIYATADILQSRTDLGLTAYLEFAKGWAEMGANIIGGCCEVGPAHIAAMAGHFK